MTVKKDPRRMYVSLSFSCPPEMEEAINYRAAKLRMSRSEYLRRLFEHDLYQAGLFDPAQGNISAPPRIKRGQQPKNDEPQKRHKRADLAKTDQAL